MLVRHLVRAVILAVAVPNLVAAQDGAVSVSAANAQVVAA